MSFSWQQATAMPTGVHAEFAMYGIDAVTIETSMQPDEVKHSCMKHHIQLPIHQRFFIRAKQPS